MKRRLLLALGVPAMVAATKAPASPGEAMLILQGIGGQSESHAVKEGRWTEYGPAASAGMLDSAATSPDIIADMRSIRVPDYHDRPQGTGAGSLVIRGRFRGCAVGKRYAGAQFAGSGMSAVRYELTDVVITECAPRETTFDYAKVMVHGSKKKER